MYTGTLMISFSLLVNSINMLRISNFLSPAQILKINTTLQICLKPQICTSNCPFRGMAKEKLLITSQSLSLHSESSLFQLIETPSFQLLRSKAFKSALILLFHNIHLKQSGNLIVPPFKIYSESNHSSLPLPLPSSPSHQYLSSGLLQYPPNQS